MKTMLIHAAVAITLATPSISATLTDTFSSFWVLGDSLSDNGNLFALTDFPPTPYFEGRFSNGPVWNESIAAEFTISGNLAFGSARTVGGLVPSLATQVLTFGSVTTGLLGDRPLVSVWAGGNDVRDALSVGDATTAANNVKQSIEDLAEFGVTDFLVFNLPDLGAIPETIGTDDAIGATVLSGAFNATLLANNEILEGKDLNIIEVDIFDLFKNVADIPGDFGLTNVEDECISNPVECIPDKWLFWDNIHPTAVGHSIVEARVRDEINANISVVPLPAGVALYLSALFFVGAIARRSTRKIL